MDTTYQWLARFAQSAGLLYFVGIFLAVCLYAFWPRNRARFEQAALAPLRED
jgi:cytochrome c oxidase cbb3-type subunit 4